MGGLFEVLSDNEVAEHHHLRIHQSTPVEILDAMHEAVENNHASAIDSLIRHTQSDKEKWSLPPSPTPENAFSHLMLEAVKWAIRRKGEDVALLVLGKIILSDEDSRKLLVMATFNSLCRVIEVLLPQGVPALIAECRQEEEGLMKMATRDVMIELLLRCVSNSHWTHVHDLATAWGVESRELDAWEVGSRLKNNLSGTHPSGTVRVRL